MPGDLIDVKSTFLDGGTGKTFPCDAVLLNGSVLVNEAMLTGESDYKWKTSCEANIDSKRGQPLEPHALRRYHRHKKREAKRNDERSLLCCILRQDGVHDERRGNHA